MKKLSGFCIAFSLVQGLWAQASFEEKVTSVSNIGMTINNLGMVGNSFNGSFDVLGYPSCEYPANSGIEHIFDGGLWIGAKINGSTVAVTTGAVDASAGYSTGQKGFEFSAPVGSGLTERSSLFDSPYYTPLAISHQDFVSDFADSATTVPGTNILLQEHTNPLDVSVHFESYNWNYPFANFFVILNYRITNVGTQTLDDLRLGYWVDGVIRNVNITPPGGSAFFNKGGNGYIDSLYMGYEFDATGNPGFTESYVATKFLGAENNLRFFHPDLDTAFKGKYNSWQFNNTADLLFFFPSTEIQKFGKMEAGLNDNQCWDRPMPPTCGAKSIRETLRDPNNRSNLVAVGPFPSLQPGQSLDIAFAIICAKKVDDGNPNTADTDVQRENLVQNANWAQTAYNGEDVNFNGVLDAGEDRDGNGRITRFILPSPPDLPNTRIVAGDHRIDVYWDKKAENSVDPISKKKDFEGYRIYKTQVGFDVQETQDILSALNTAGEFDLPGNQLFYDTGLDAIRLATPMTFEGDTTKYWYKYSFEGIQNGWQHAVAVTAFDGGDAVNNLESLESSPLATLKRVFPGKPANEGLTEDPFVYPNPYYAGASWEGSSTYEEDRKIIFANLPAHCEVRIYTLAGDLVDEFEHNGEYKGDDIRWFETYSQTDETTFSGGEHAWDMLSADNQIIARGIYLFSVKDMDSGKNFKGKFVIIK